MILHKFFIFFIFFFLLSGTSFSATYLWDFSERTNWGNTMPDGDIYGNTDVWYYQYKSAGGSFVSSTYNNLPYWYNSGWRLSKNTSDNNYWCSVAYSNTVIIGSNNYDSIIKFVVQISGEYDIYIKLKDVNPGGDGEKFYLAKNDTILEQTTNTADGTRIFSRTEFLNADDAIYLRVNSLGWSSQDNVEIQEFWLQTEVAPIPEPGSLILLASGVIAILKRRNIFA